MAENKNKSVVFLSSITSDIGTYLAKKYLEKGDIVCGSYRNKDSLERLGPIPKENLVYCDISKKESINSMIGNYKKLGLKWDTFISCAGTQKPIGNFFKCDFNEWSDSIHTNAIEQLRVLHRMHPYRNKEKVSNAIFFAGGGTNNPVLNYSAYTISKIMLIKMCELIDFENSDLKLSIVGPGWVKTKMQYETINESKEKVGANYEKTVEFMEKGQGTKMQDIFNCIDWICNSEKEVSGGRNFSVVYDKWGSKELEEILKKDKNLYKLRRFGNEVLKK
ncbi:MAG: SDR family oxidoreductase [Candidatus Nanoarchaeia archaeon]